MSIILLCDPSSTKIILVISCRILEIVNGTSVDVLLHGAAHDTASRSTEVKKYDIIRFVRGGVFVSYAAVCRQFLFFTYIVEKKKIDFTGLMLYCRRSRRGEVVPTYIHTHI